MSKHFLLTSKKPALIFAIIYFVVRCLYILTPLVITHLIHTVEENDIQAFGYACAGYVLLFIVTQIMDYYSDIAEENCYADAFMNLIHLISHKISTRDYRYTQLSLDEISQLTGQEFEKANKYFFVEIIRLIYYIGSVLFIMAVLFINEWRIALLITLLFLVLIPLNAKTGRKIDEKSARSLNAMSRIKDIVSDQYHTAKEDRFLKNKQIDSSIYAKAYDTFRHAFAEKNRHQSFYLNIISYGSLNMIIMVMLICACFFVLQGKITFSTLYLFNSYTSQLWTPGEFIFGFRSQYAENKPVFDKIRKLMSMKEMTEKEQGTLDQISLLNYQGTGKEGIVLHQPLNITFHNNMIYLVKGDNGAGKTTLVENLLHLSNRYNGRILYNNKEDFAGDFTYIPSKPYISKYFNEPMSLASDGQKKLYQIEHDLTDAGTAIILDEPTNYLDAAHKEKFIDSLPALRQNHILIVISHDPAFQRIADEMMVINLQKTA